MYVLMFYLQDETLISFTISSVVAHLTLKRSPSISSYLTEPTVLASRLATGGREVADGVEEVVFTCVLLCVCLQWKSDVCVYVQDSIFFFFFNTHVCECVLACALMCVTGVSSYVRGEVTPSLLTLGVCRGSYQLSK